MPSAAPLASEQSFDSIEAVITELLDGFTREADLREDLVAGGVPLLTIQMLVELAKSGPESELILLKEKSVQLAQEKYGLKAVTAAELEDGVERLKYLAEDILFVRKVARGMDLDPQSINMLAQLVLRNPGDRGQKVLNAMVDYANACGISVNGTQAQQSTPQVVQSVLPKIDIQQPEHQGLMKYKNVIIELALGIAVTFTALSLLT